MPLKRRIVHIPDMKTATKAEVDRFIEVLGGFAVDMAGGSKRWGGYLLLLAGEALLGQHTMECAVDLMRREQEPPQSGGAPNKEAGT